ncbi:hypothetical protein HGO75_20625, partial [Mycobacterium tuberculosis]|nr:hypothetical protein [Mycobacterium tuberculosis]
MSRLTAATTLSHSKTLSGVLPNAGRANLEQAGLRGLLRVISSEHPMLRTTLIDVDEH